MLSAPAMELPQAALDEAKAFLRIGTSEEDALLARLLASAADLCEQFTGRALLTRTFVETIAAEGAWVRLEAAPVSAITLIESLSAAGAATALPMDAYAVDVDANGEGWVRVIAPGESRRFKVSYTAGLAASWTAVPEALRHGILRLAAHLYANRDGANAAPPAAVTALWRPWRRMRLR